MSTRSERQRGRALYWAMGTLGVLVLAIAAAMLWWHSHGDAVLAGLREGATVAIEQGKQLGLGSDHHACLDQATARAETCGTADLLCEVNAGLFMKACLENTRDKATYCATVPAEDEIMATALQSVQTCADLNRPTERCARVVREGQKACRGNPGRR